METQSLVMPQPFRFEQTDTSEDTEAVRKAMTGDGRAFAGIYRLNLPRVFAICLRMTADPRLAEELSREVLAKTWEMLSQYRGESPLSAWIRQIAVNVVLDHLRSQKRLRSRIEFTDQSLEFEERETSPLAHDRIDLETAIAALPPQARAVLILHDIEGFSHEEISDLMKIAPGTSKAHLHAARRRLKEVLQQ